jgi:hypothetical protein
VGVFEGDHSVAVAAEDPQVNKGTKTNEGLFSGRNDANPAIEVFRGIWMPRLGLEEGRNVPVPMKPESSACVGLGEGELCGDLQGGEGAKRWKQIGTRQTHLKLKEREKGYRKVDRGSGWSRRRGKLEEDGLGKEGEGGGRLFGVGIDLHYTIAITITMTITTATTTAPMAHVPFDLITLTLCISLSFPQQCASTILLRPLYSPSVWFGGPSVIVATINPPSRANRPPLTTCYSPGYKSKADKPYFPHFFETHFIYPTTESLSGPGLIYSDPCRSYSPLPCTES